MTNAPRLSIGLPVYNGENYVAEAIDNLLAQTFTDFELVISDNASTDGTREICEKYAAKDERIRYLRQPCNIGAAPNHNFVVQASRGEFFKWAAHDDLFAPELLEKCVRALDEHPEAVLAHSHMAIVDERGEILENYDYTLDTDSPDTAKRFRSLMFVEGGDDFYGVIRTSVMRRIAPHDSYHNAGRKLVGELALYGTFVQVPRSCSSGASTPAAATTWVRCRRCARTSTRAARASRRRGCSPPTSPGTSSRSGGRRCRRASGGAATASSPSGWAASPCGRRG